VSGSGPHAAVGADDQVGREFVQDLGKVVEGERGYEYVGADQAGCATALLSELFSQHRPRYLAH
jgi:hypothetical protein